MSTKNSLRAMLFIPGTSEKMFEKIPSLSPGAFILDLEDSVPPREKDRARRLVGDFLRETGDRFELHVRINSMTSPYLDADLASVVTGNLSGIIVPKVEHPDDLRILNGRIDSIASELGQNLDHIGLTATIETTTGVRSVYDIAKVGGHLRRLSFGSGDFALDLGLDWPDEEGVPEIMLLAKSELVLASRAAGMEQPHDGAYTNFRDPEGLAREARQSRRLGFAGKHVIHPMQIAIVNEIFQPSPRQIERAQRLVAAFKLAEESGTGAIGIDGELVDYAIIKRARRLLEELDE